MQQIIDIKSQKNVNKGNIQIKPSVISKGVNQLFHNSFILFHDWEKGNFGEIWGKL